MQKQTIIRMGAAHWDAQIPTADGVLHFDFRSMSKDDKRKFHSAFMAAYRKANPFKPKKGKQAA
jgi:hypothetical protein